MARLSTVAVFLLCACLAVGAYVTPAKLSGVPLMGSGLGNRMAVSEDLIALSYFSGKHVTFVIIKNGSAVEIGSLTTPCDCSAIALSQNYFGCTCSNILHVYPRKGLKIEVDGHLEHLLEGTVQPDALDFDEKRSAVVGYIYPRGAAIINDLSNPAKPPVVLQNVKNMTEFSDFGSAVSLKSGHAIVSDSRWSHLAKRPRGVSFKGTTVSYCRNSGGRNNWGQCGNPYIAGRGFHHYFGQTVQYTPGFLLASSNYDIQLFHRDAAIGQWQPVFGMPAPPGSVAHMSGRFVLIVVPSDQIGIPTEIRLIDKGRNDDALVKMLHSAQPEEESDATAIVYSMFVHHTGNSQFGARAKIVGNSVVLTAASESNPWEDRPHGALYTIPIDQILSGNVASLDGQDPLEEMEQYLMLLNGSLQTMNSHENRPFANSTLLSICGTLLGVLLGLSLIRRRTTQQNTSQIVDFEIE